MPISLTNSNQTLSNIKLGRADYLWLKYKGPLLFFYIFKYWRCIRTHLPLANNYFLVAKILIRNVNSCFLLFTNLNYSAVCLWNKEDSHLRFLKVFFYLPNVEIIILPYHKGQVRIGRLIIYKLSIIETRKSILVDIWHIFAFAMF